MPSQISGQAPKPSKNVARKAKKPAIVGVGEGLAAMGYGAAKSTGHAAHDAVHLGRRVVKKLNPFD